MTQFTVPLTHTIRIAEILLQRDRELLRYADEAAAGDGEAADRLVGAFVSGYLTRKCHQDEAAADQRIPTVVEAFKEDPSILFEILAGAHVAIDKLWQATTAAMSVQVDD